eukprot:m.124990 g.124990  ORF g.124990 m.124990 type:complete len:414 (-) comp17312_c0_seq1:139-1380(-)
MAAQERSGTAMLSTAALLSLYVGASFGAMELKLIPKDEAENGAAYCLDGTVPAFWYEKATNETVADNWVIYLQGGGACTSLSSCEHAAGGNRGSSNKQPKTYNGRGPTSASASSNPVFHAWNHVTFLYCDGLFFAGNVEGKVNTTSGKDLYFRGFNILNTLLDHLVEKYDLHKAKEVLLTGCSAGGYSTYLHTDYVHEYLKKKASGLTKYKSAPLSGLFVNGSNDKGDYPFGVLMKENFKLHNVTTGVNKHCLEGEKGQPSKCAAPEDNFAYTQAPIFLANSLVDYGTIFYSYFNPKPAGSDCVRHVPTCSDAIVENLIRVQDDTTKMLTTIKPKEAKIPSIERPGNGAFLHNCVAHCSVEGNTIKVNGVGAMEAIGNWYVDAIDADPRKHTHIERCKMTTAAPKICNPTCPK